MFMSSPPSLIALGRAPTAHLQLPCALIQAPNVGCYSSLEDFACRLPLLSSSSLPTLFSNDARSPRQFCVTWVEGRWWMGPRSPDLASLGLCELNSLLASPGTKRSPTVEVSDFWDFFLLKMLS